MTRNTWFELLRTGVAIAVALLIGFVVTWWSQNPREARILSGPSQASDDWGFSEAAVPLTFTGLAVSLVFPPASLTWERNFFIGAVAATAADFPPARDPHLVCLAAGMAAGQ